ncbi:MULTISPECIES: nuclear transport factor 2 family protein [unclassified Rhizobium]|jgi:ketosteroid isomerase-like protein|uniref:nuclear transport factor 2 family protein n=1 Tax=unclassified Rhizobium TaxID=2613769 RepID=UPI000645E77B|nr:MULTISPECIES: nuclear transport factor 2 family protein [unclassified Rhizobium]MBN8951876.1 nuclear transport factor 2 family protein [Rhizobium tropici]OJY73885.1 MAG: hypothetical protein BGP09_26060 [Rhizobium sp. 60-20]RKD61825.1 SnoaL-like protein [Rhizobium sp. WW_1]
MSNDLQSFQKFMALRNDIAVAFVNGDAGPVLEITTNTPPFSFFGPKGGQELDLARATASFSIDAAQFGQGESQFDIAQLSACDGLAFWSGVQRVEAKLVGKTETMQFNLRVTEVFKKSDEGWKMIHRHADALGH